MDDHSPGGKEVKFERRASSITGSLTRKRTSVADEKGSFSIKPKVQIKPQVLKLVARKSSLISHSSRKTQPKKSLGHFIDQYTRFLNESISQEESIKASRNMNYLSQRTQKNEYYSLTRPKDNFKSL